MADKALNRTQKGALLAVGLIILSILVPQVYFRNFSPEARAAHRFIREMPLAEIQEIEVAPDPDSERKQTVTIKDQASLREMADALRTAIPFEPSHPLARWTATLRILTDHGQYGGTVLASSNGQGVTIWYASNIEGGWHYGIYRQDRLGPLLEKLLGNSIQ